VFSWPIRYRVRVLFPKSKSNLKAVPVNQGRHRTEMQEQEEQLPDEELESYLAALSPEGDLETTGAGRRFGAPQVYQLRLSLIANEQLRELAAHRQTSPMALAQEWVMQRLEWECQQLHQRR
jgi:hypothetical protein